MVMVMLLLLTVTQPTVAGQHSHLLLSQLRARVGLVADKFKLAKVDSLDISHDGKKRTVNLEYVTMGEGGKVPRRRMKRAVQKLALVAKASELSEGESFQVNEKHDDFNINTVAKV